MEYNTTRPEIHVREYGRNIQMLVETLCQVENAEERLSMAKKTVQVLKMINPQYRTSENSDQKIWDMLHYISDFKLQVDGPYPVPPKDNFDFKPDTLKYNSRRGKKGYHLGQNLVNLVEIAKQTEDEEARAHLVKLIAHYMRIAYFSWHLELPNNTFIQNEIHQLSEGALVYDINSAPKTAHYAQLAQDKNLNQQKRTTSPHLNNKNKKRR